MSVAELLDGRRVCVCGGAGGVGKTTRAAAVALGMAQRGLKVGVVTIDPARRLANALGLQELDNEPRRVDSAHLGAEVSGELWAMMLDPKRTFDELIDRVAPDPQRAQEIRANRVYAELSGAVSGSQEFTAVAKLYELDREGGFDLLVLDTPPSRNALDFLEAPGRLTAFLDGSAIRTLIRPTGLGMRVLGRGASPLLGALRRITGLDLIGDLQTFFGLLGSMTEEFSVRAARVDRMLHADTTAFLLVTAASEPAVAEAIWFRRALRDAELPFAGMIVNRVHHHRSRPEDGDARQIAAALPARLGVDLTRRVAETSAEYHRLARRDASHLAELSAELDLAAGEAIIEVPQLDEDVHDVAGLRRVAAFLFASAPEREALIAELVA